MEPFDDDYVTRTDVREMIDAANVGAVVRVTFNETAGAFGCSGASATNYHRIHWAASAEL